MEGQVSLFDPDLWSGKMYQAHLVQTKEKISKKFLKKQLRLQNQMLPTFHYLKNGHWLIAGWGLDGPLPTEFLMHSFGESPSEDVESHLSQILEDTVPLKYYLSEKACKGILRRAKNRGKELPAILKYALQQQAGISTEYIITETKNKEEQCFCIAGNTIGRKEQNGGNGNGWKKDISYTLNTVDRHAVCFRESSFGGFKNRVGTLRSSGGALGGGSENLVMDARGNGNGDICPTITGDHQNCITDYTAICINKQTVRRLTPLECERLQGFPDRWTDIPGASDTARYKALGNSIALPPWKWVLKRICANYERDATLGSLFDGIGGFPLIWEQINGKGSCIWTSEIEKFPIAVTQFHFNEETI